MVQAWDSVMAMALVVGDVATEFTASGDTWNPAVFAADLLLVLILSFRPIGDD